MSKATWMTVVVTAGMYLLVAGTAFASSAPTAADDTYSVDEGGTLEVDVGDGVLFNDTHPEGDFTAVLVDGPSNGTLTLADDGSFSYTHNGSETTSDSFTYKAKETSGGLESADATVTITIDPVNDAPIAVPDDVYTVEQGEELEVDAGSGVLANDADAEDDDLTAVLVDGPSNGTLTLDDDGSFSYTHDGSETTSDSFTYKAKETGGDELESEVTTVTITITIGEPEDDGDGVKRKGFVGVVANKTTESFDVEFPDASFETIALPVEYRLKRPGKPGKNQGDFVDGARVAVLAQLLEDGSWEAVQVLVKPVGHGSHVVTGPVMGTEDGVVTILLPNGKTKKVKLPPGADAPEEGEVVTTLVEGPPDTDGEGEEEGPPANATGLVSAAKVRDRLQRHLDELTAEAGDLPEGKAQARAKRVQRLSELLESHGDRHLGILNNALGHVKNDKAKAAIQNAKQTAEEGRQKSKATIERARGRAGSPPKGQPEESRGGPPREFEEDLYVDKQEPSHAGPGPDPTTESKSARLTQGGIRWFVGGTVEYRVVGTELVAGAAVDKMIVAFGVIDGFVTTRSFVRNDSTTQENPCTGEPNQVEWGPIDGPGGTIAFAATCRNVATKEIVGFRVKFDSEETWTIGSPVDMDVLNVAVHEFGHVAGLGHVNAPKDGCLTMYRFAGTGETQKGTLGLGDKLGLDALYDTGDPSPGPGCGS